MGAIPKDDVSPPGAGPVVHFHANKTGMDLFKLFYEILMVLHNLADFGFQWQLLAGEIMITIIQDYFIISSVKEFGLHFENPDSYTEN